MAEEDIIQRIRLEGDRELVAQLTRIGDAGTAQWKRVEKGAQEASKTVDKSSAQIARNVENIAGRFGILGTGAAAAGRAVERAFSNMSPAVAAFTLALTGGIAAITAVTGGLFKLAESASKVAESVKEGAAATGQSVEDYQRLNFAISLATKGAANMDSVYNRLNAIIADAGDESNATTKKFKELGVRLTDGGGRARSAQDIFLDLADSVGRLDEKTRTATLIGIFGPRQGGLFSQLMAEGRKGIQGLIKDADRLNIVLTKAETEIGDNFGDAMTRLGKSIEITRTRLGLLFAPSFTEGANKFAEFIADNQATIVEFGKRVAAVMNDIFAALTGNPDKVQGSFIFIIAKGMELAINVTKGWIIILGQLNKVLNLAFEGINKIFGTNFSTGDFAIVGVVLVAVKVLGTFLTVIGFVTRALGIMRIAALAAAIPFSPWILIIGALVIAITALVVALSKVNWTAFAAQAAAFFTSIGAKAQAGVAYLIQVWNGWVTYFQGIWAQIQTFPDVAWNYITTQAAGIVARLQGYWTGFVTWLAGMWASVRQLGANLWNTISTAAAEAIAFIQEQWNMFVEWFQGLFAPVGEFITEVWNQLKEGAQEVIDFLTEKWEGWTNTIIGFFTKIADFIKKTWDDVKDIVGQLFGGEEQAQGASGGGGGGFKSGGMIRGPGTGTSDSIIARVSRGEFVARAAAVRKYGAGLFYALNNLRFNPDMLKGFADGGLVMPSVQPRFAFADGGLVGGQKNVLNLTIGNQTFENLSAPDATMENLRRFAAQQSVRSAGRKPGWYGG